MVDAVILCGGLGTRLREAVPDRPKPMADVGGRPFLELLVDWVAGQGFNRIILCVGHRADMVRAHFRSDSRREILFSEEREPLGTGGALRLCRPHGASDPFLVLNGDSFCDIDLHAMLQFHAEKKAAATVAAVRPDGREDGGNIAAGTDMRVSAFAEKKKTEGAAWLNAGVYALGSRVWDFIPPGRSSLETDVLPKMLLAGVYVFATSATLFDIGTPARLEAFRRLRS